MVDWCGETPPVPPYKRLGYKKTLALRWNDFALSAVWLVRSIVPMSPTEFGLIEPLFHCASQPSS